MKELECKCWDEGEPLLGGKYPDGLAMGPTKPDSSKFGPVKQLYLDGF